MAGGWSISTTSGSAARPWPGRSPRPTTGSGSTGADGPALAAAAAALLAATELPRERQKGGSTVRYDLRPLLVDVGVVDGGPPVVLRARTRFHPVLGTGRPEEVVAALGDAVGAPLVVASIVRERLILADEQDPDTA